MGEYLQSFDIRNKRGISATAVLGILFLAAGIAGHLKLLEGLTGPEAAAHNIFLSFLPNYKTGLVYALIGLALAGIGMMPDKYVKADLYTDALVLYRKDDGAESSKDVFLFDELDAIVASERGLGDPQSLLLVRENGQKIQLMIPPRNEMPKETEGVWRSYCVRFNRAAEEQEAK